jgi:hypothetical protein
MRVWRRLSSTLNIKANEACKVKLSHYTPWRRLGGRQYSSYSFLTSSLDGGEWSPSRPSRALLQAKGPPVPIGQEAGWAPEPVWTQTLHEKSSASVGDRTLVIQSVFSHKTDWATPAPMRHVTLENMCAQNWNMHFQLLFNHMQDQTKGGVQNITIYQRETGFHYTKWFRRVSSGSLAIPWISW